MVATSNKNVNDFAHNFACQIDTFITPMLVGMGDLKCQPVSIRQAHKQHSSDILRFVSAKCKLVHLNNRRQIVVSGWSL